MLENPCHAPAMRGPFSRPDILFTTNAAALAKTCATLSTFSTSLHHSIDPARFYRKLSG
jgi:hypothetical protein